MDIIWPGKPGTQWTNETEKVAWQWICSFVNSCEFCMSMHTAISFDPWPIPAHPNCLLPGTKIVAPGIKAGLVARYNGNACRVTFADGTTVSVTPNHMLLTPSGFVRTSSLVCGDYVIQCLDGKRKLLGDPDVNWNPSTVEQIVGTLSMDSGVISASMPVSSEDLHGDGRFCKGDIDIVRTNRFLGNKHNSFAFDHRGDIFFQGTRLGRSLPCSRRVSELLIALGRATDSGVSSLRDLKAKLWSRPSHKQGASLLYSPDTYSSGHKNRPYRHSGYTKTDGDRLFAFTRNIAVNNRVFVDLFSKKPGFSDRSEYPEFPEMSQDWPLGDSKRISNAFSRFPGQVTFCRISNIDWFHYSGPVYDVETTSTVYALENGVASSNCACFQEEVYPGKESEPFVHFDEYLKKLSEDEKERSIGRSVWKLIKNKVISWEDAVTPDRIKTLAEIVKTKKLTVEQMAKAGVNRSVAERAVNYSKAEIAEIIKAHREGITKQISEAAKWAATLRNAVVAGAKGARLSGLERPGWQSRTGVHPLHQAPTGLPFGDADRAALIARYLKRWPDIPEGVLWFIIEEETPPKPKTNVK